MYHSSISSSSSSSCYGKSDGRFLVSGAAAPFVGSGAFRPSESLPSASSCLLLSRHNLQLLHRSSPHLLQQQPCYGAHLASQSGMAVAPSRRVLSTGDLVEEHPRAVAGGYSAGERRERIEKYRSKRNRRNFGKKITVRYVNSALIHMAYIPSPSSECPLIPLSCRLADLSIANKLCRAMHSTHACACILICLFSTHAGRRLRTAGRG